MKTLLQTFILYLFCQSVAIAQTPQKVRDYYKYINLAELAICDSDFVKAEQAYAKAFTLHPRKGFIRDKENAFHAAMDAGNYVAAETYYAAMMNSGVDTATYRKIITTYTGTDKVRIDAFVKKYSNKYAPDNALIKKLNDMHDRDQGVREYFAELYGGQYMVDSAYTVDAINAQELYKIFTQKGIPDEAVMRETGFDIIIQHNGGAAYGGRASHIFDTLLYNAACRFEVDMRFAVQMIKHSAPEEYFSCRGMRLWTGGPSYDAAFYHKKYYPIYYDRSSEDKINEARNMVGLESYTDYVRKLIALNALTNRNSKLHKYSMLNGLMLLDFEDENRFNKWIGENGPDANPRPSIIGQKFVKPGRLPFDAGSFGSYVLGVTRYDSLYNQFKNTGEWYVANIPYSPKQMYAEARLKKRGYYASVIVNNSDSITPEGKEAIAKFVQGYRMLVNSGYSMWAMGITRCEYSFYNGLLMHLKANADTFAYKVITKYIGKPTSYTETADTVKYPPSPQYVVVLKKRKYTWVKGDNMMVVSMTDDMNKEGKKKTKVVFEMIDKPLYEEYSRKVDEAFRRLTRGN